MVKISISDLSTDDKDLMDFISDDSDDGDQEAFEQKLAKFEPPEQLNHQFPDTLVVLGMPEIPAEKVAKLQEVIKKLVDLVFANKMAQPPAYKIEMPLNDEGGTFGFAFFTFDSAIEAQNARKMIDGLALDSRHKFKVTPIDQVEEIANRSEEYKALDRLPGYTRENFRWWLFDDRSRAQFVVRYQDKTEIYWNDTLEREPVFLYDGHRENATLWTDSRVQWSPQGSYLVTFHLPGIALWAGEKFDKKVRFRHEKVKFIDFSPNEEYLLTWDGTPAPKSSAGGGFEASMGSHESVRIWKVMTGKALASFQTPIATPREGDFPLFLWSHDSKYISRMGEDGIYVYSLPSMELLADSTKKQSPLRYNLTQFDWSPGENIISIWIQKSKSESSRLYLIEIPSRKQLAYKNLYDVENGSMHWQSKGDLLALRTYLKKRVDGKKKMRYYTQLEIFRMREKNIPVDIVQIDDSQVKQFKWEEGPNCRRFALIVEDDVAKESAIHFYRVSDSQGYTNTVLIEKFELSNMGFTTMEWSPMGSNFILGVKNDAQLQFCTLNDSEKVEVIHKDEHLTVTELSWSSCGRYVCTASTVPIGGTHFSPNTGYCIWSFQGKSIYKSNKERFYQFLWRPHPPLMISDKKVEDIKKNLKDYSRKFDSIDEKLRSAQRDAFLTIRRKELAEFDATLQEIERWKENQPMFLTFKAAWDEYYSMFSWEERVDIREEVLESREEKVSHA